MGDVKNETEQDIRAALDMLVVSKRIGGTWMRCLDCSEDFVPTAWRYDGQQHCPACRSIEYIGHDEIQSELLEQLEGLKP